MKKLALLAAVSVAAMSATACFDFESKSSLGPTATGISALAGTWSSSNLIPSASTCTDFKWDAREQTATSAGGSFSATCAGDLKLSGNAQGVLSSSAIKWTADGNATAPGLTTCKITLTGTAELTSDSIRVPYEGTTCLGPVAGVENLRRR
jgi:hypothetical protein